MSEEDLAIEHGDEPNEFELIENFIVSVLPNASQPSEAEVETINAASSYDKQAMRSNIILSMANLIEMVTYLDNPDEEIEPDTIASIDILTMEVFAEMVRFAFVLNGADAKLFIGRVLSAFDYNENNPPASADNTPVRYLEEALAYFIQEDEDDVKTFLRSLQQLNHARPDLEAIKWIGGQMFNREGGECLDYNDFIELVVVPYEQKLPEREAKRALANFGGEGLPEGEEGHMPVAKLFVEQLDELLAQGREIGNQVETKLDGQPTSFDEQVAQLRAEGRGPDDLATATWQATGGTAGYAPGDHPMEHQLGIASPRQQIGLGYPDEPVISVMVREPTLEEAAQGYSPTADVNVKLVDMPGVGEDGILVSQDALDKMAFKTFEFEGKHRGDNGMPLNMYGDDPFTQIPPSLLKKD